MQRGLGSNPGFIYFSPGDKLLSLDFFTYSIGMIITVPRSTIF